MSSAGLQVALDPVAQCGVPIPAIDEGLGDTDALGCEFVVAGVLRRQDGVSARQEKAGRDLRLDCQK